jgi:PAS domain S-box-containing protein
MIANHVRVCLIDDDKGDFIITEDLLAESLYTKFELGWCVTYQEAMAELKAENYDVYLIDLHLGHANGIQIISECVAAGCSKPLILLTGSNDREIDMQALQVGAADYLAKGTFNAAMLERSILYAIRHRATLNQLRLSESRYRTVLETQTELVCRFMLDTTLTFVNSAYARYFGESAESLIGKSWLQYIPQDQHEGIRSHLRQIQEAKCSISYEHSVLSGEGVLRWQQWTDQPVLDEVGNVLEIQSVGIDITDRKNAEIALRQALERERELGDLKSRFVTMASHEFRTPLTTIMSTASYLEMAEGQVSSEKRLSRLAKIQSAAADMTQLLDDVLVFGKAEANRLDYQPKSMDIVAFSTEILEDVQAGLGNEHVIEFRNQLQNYKLMADEKLLRQIITNLLTNAVKYSAKGSRVLFELAQERNRLSFTVQDEGMGIPEHDLEHLFEPFHRAKNAKDISGTGLGLAITKKAVELHHGDIRVESMLNEGTCIKITIPNELWGE